ncbi:hypothetical protein [Thermoflavimicrobium dichotomicum]|uniref:Integral membrane protein n=1 Tax=Thermoflavimicrobium dichotomicum TaxID=46223 RepID=A0A1I3LL66_9BACL|nr:hypothetical protein [Thermoflavimicrobium dichotomicum]SFI85235.1 hypothetical protein SAMN05421852_102231 [Thermoflavimicrobium dichotomicum]
MLEFLSSYRYIFLVGAEVVFWGALTSFLILRYVFRLEKVSFIAIPIILINECFIAFLGYIDYQVTGKFSAFQVITLIIILYSLTYGKKDLKRLDHFVKRQVAKWRGEAVPSKLPVEKLYGWTHTKQELKDWFIHLFIYLTVHSVFIFTIGFHDDIAQFLDHPSFSIQSGQIHLFKNETITRISFVWTIVFLTDTLITLSYIIFPKRKKD